MKTSSITPGPVEPSSVRSGKVVVVHNGARDRYQVALALSKAGLLECLVTDFFWSEETTYGRMLAALLPQRVLAILRQRSAPGLPKSQVKTCLSAGIGGFLLDKARFVPFNVRRWLTRKADARLGHLAGNTAARRGAELLSYSYYAFDAFRAAGRAGILFQLHPHPETMRSLLQAELEAHPDCAHSLQQEWELNLPSEDFERLVRETTMPHTSLAASSFTKRSLLMHGVKANSVRVVQYGIDLEKFRPDLTLKRDVSKPLRLLFVGRINQRKGIKYLLEALALLPDAPIELTVCGRVLDGLELFKQEARRVTVRASVSSEELVKAYQDADLFVLPSVAEGFGQVLLEALACGLPVLSTTNTAAPDLIHNGVEGFVVDPRSPEQIAERLAWSLTHREELLAMRLAARSCAETFPWSRFHEGVVRCVRDVMASNAAYEEAA
ncbi:glycosyltransferase family 4 protein [Terriglobus sp. TAA 43]|uniref:glycosyltransferase family 4 protein n=1 Tax=Terriglobus sp. TAA 43 TaxID=278961 RepID=UPI00068A312E|nr:glycosyltransferase family 4 protein [Terriglobus sp. TAA 43]